jgi:NAD(P)-dependent dehydrogenase (short-subunit alcohol dehydrogenase family)/acyl dehydratase/putative sterol carrier protein
MGNESRFNVAERPMGLLDGKVVLVTGAGGGIGRCHALACAKEGARIVVNDLGGSRDGTGAGQNMADQVVAEILEMGGDAVANYDSVTDTEGCERMVKAATDKWDRLDVVVNNAGILRDRTFAKMSEDQWNLVIDVHLHGTKNVVKASLDALRANGGSIINTSSYSGMIGNFGQSNYGAAKAGIYGFTRVLALELRKYGITANCISPVAKTRMTDDISMVEDDWTPEQISPIVVFLASDLGKSTTGRVFGVQGQRLHLYEVKTNEGVEKPGSDLWTAVEIHEKLDDIMRFEQPTAAASGGEDDLVGQAFSTFPAGFRPDGVPGWSAVFHWEISGGSSQTVTVENGVCAVSAGLNGQPTCTVKTTQEVVLALLSGEMDPQKVFMTGKASADNMGDLMKMAMAFDFEKIGAEIARLHAADEDTVSMVFSHFPQGFKKDAVPGWTANLQWVVKDGTDQTVMIEDGTCSVAEGLEGEPTCTVKIGREILLDLFMGRTDPQKVFMTGKATADNMGDLMKMGMAFDFETIAKAVESTQPSAAPKSEPETTEAPKTMPLGKRYEGGYWQVDETEYRAYADATDDRNDAYLGAGSIAPPMYHVKPFIDVMFKMASDPELELDLLRLVHAEHDMVFHAPMKHGDILQLRGTLKSVEEKSSGRLVNYGLVGFLDGEIALEGNTSYFIRGKRRKEGSGKPKAKAPAPELPPVSWSKVQAVTDDQALRYAAASGDDNPIHVDENTAKAAGLPKCILHGLCTMALAQRDIINQYCDGDPSRLKRLAVRWAKPVFPGEQLELKVWEQDNGALSFITENESGQVVVTNGRAEVRPG